MDSKQQTRLAMPTVGLVIGKGGETIKNMQARTGTRIQVILLHLPPGDTSKKRTVQIDGTSEQIEAAKQLVNELNEVISEFAGCIKNQYYTHLNMTRSEVNGVNLFTPM